MKNIASMKRIAITLWPYILYSMIVCFFWTQYYSQFTPNDAISYLSIASKYANGQYSTAINGYWSPFVCWLIAAVSKIGLQPIPAFYIIKVASGLLVLYWGQKIISLLAWPNWATHSARANLAIIAAYLTLHHLTPDALLTALLLCLLYLLLSKKWTAHPLLTGLLGAAIYFTKAYGFYFFAALFIVWALWLLLIRQQNLIHHLKKTAIVLFVFLSVSSLWIIALESRYYSYIISSAGPYNHGITKYADGGWHQSLKSGLLPLSDSAAFNPWEEITLVHSYEKWSAFESVKTMQLQALRIAQNTWFFLQKIYGITPLFWMALLYGLVLLCAYIWTYIKKRPIASQLEQPVAIFAFAMLYTSGYLLVLVEDRYVWLVHISLLLLLTALTVAIAKKIALPPLLQKIAGLFLVGIIAFSMVGRLRFFSNELARQLGEVKILQTIVPPKSIVATHETNSINAMDYIAHWQNHGGLEGYNSIANMKEGLKKFHIQWVLIPDSVKNRYEWLQNESDTIITTKNWMVYKLHTDTMGTSVK